MAAAALWQSRCALARGWCVPFFLGASSPALLAEERREAGVACDTLSRGASEIAPLHAARLPLPSGAARPSPCATVGSGYFWTLFYFGPGKKIIALRNLIELHDDGHCEHVKLALKPVGSAAKSDANETKAFLRERVHVPMGKGCGQWCRLSPTAEERIVRQYKDISRVAGKSNSVGIDVAQFGLDELRQYSLLAGNSAALTQADCAKIPTLDYPVHSDEDIELFADVQNRLSFNIESRTNIYTCPMADQCSLHKNLIAEMKNLPLGLPVACESFRAAEFTGNAHGIGTVPAINEQQFVVASGCENAWVRFDKKDLLRFEHDFEGIPCFEDGNGILIPCTHLWVDCSFDESACTFEWFTGPLCVARKEWKFWWLPYYMFKRIVGYVANRWQFASSL